MGNNKLEKDLLDFRTQRDWEKFHNPKDLAISISLEASELLEVFQWSGTDLTVSKKLPQIKEELADIFIYCFYMAHDLNLNINEIIEEKLKQNKQKYPAEKVKGSAKKYTEYEE